MYKNLNRETLTEVAGWIGITLVLLAYALLTFGYVDAASPIYHVMNLVGGVGIIVDAVADKNYQPAVLNLVWIGIAVYAIVRVFV